MTYAHPLISPLFGASRYPALRPALRHSNPLGSVVPAYAKTTRAVLFPETRQDPRGARVDPRPYVKNEDLPNGVILWEGPSRFDGAPIVVILTGIIDPSDNVKTEDMIQSWVLRADVEPHIAVKTGEDGSVCASCPQRPVLVREGAAPVWGTRKGAPYITKYRRPDGSFIKKNETCYVRTHNAPLSIYRTYRKGGYPRVDAATVARLVAGRILRIGSYGDPVASPLEAGLPAIRAARGRTGYTHQWCTPAAQVWRPYLEASVEKMADALRAEAMGWHPFRAGYDPLQPGEAMCPASKEAGAKITCAPCRQCNGEEVAPKRPSRVIRPH